MTASRTLTASNPDSVQMSMKSWLGTSTQFNASCLSDVDAGNRASFRPRCRTISHRDFSEFDLASRFNFIQPPVDVLFFYLPVIVVHNFLQRIKYHTLVQIRPSTGVKDMHRNRQVDTLLKHREPQRIGLKLDGLHIAESLLAFNKSGTATNLHKTAAVALARRLAIKFKRNC